MIAKFPYGEALVQFPAGDSAPPGFKSQLNRHRLHKLPQFEDDALVRLLDGYPPTPPYLTRERLEDIFANVVGEEMRYNPLWDRDAAVMDLEPGDWAAWPHNSPHRVENLGTFNVSITTNHVTAQNLRRSHVYLANRYLRRKWGLRSMSTGEVGPVSVCKAFGYRVCRKLGLDDAKSTFAYTPRYRIDLNSPSALLPLIG